MQLGIPVVLQPDSAREQYLVQELNVLTFQNDLKIHLFHSIFGRGQCYIQMLQNVDGLYSCCRGGMIGLDISERRGL